MKIKRITKVKPRRVYAVTTSTGTFIADGLAHHNCQQCNYWKGGNYSEFQIRLIKEIGLDEYNALHKLAKSGEKLSTTDYLELRKWYKDKYESLT